MDAILTFAEKISVARLIGIPKRVLILEEVGIWSLQIEREKQVGAGKQIFENGTTETENTRATSSSSSTNLVIESPALISSVHGP